MERSYLLINGHLLTQHTQFSRRLQRLPNNKTTLGQHVVLAGDILNLADITVFHIIGSPEYKYISPSLVFRAILLMIQSFLSYLSVRRR